MKPFLLFIFIFFRKACSVMRGFVKRNSSRLLLFNVRSNPAFSSIMLFQHKSAAVLQKITVINVANMQMFVDISVIYSIL